MKRQALLGSSGRRTSAEQLAHMIGAHSIGPCVKVIGE